MNLTKSKLVTRPNKSIIKLSENILHATLSEATKDLDYRRPSEFNEKTTVYFKHQCIPILLRCLHFDKALDGYACCLNIHEDGDNKELEFEITGPKMKVKKVARLLGKEETMVRAFKTRNNFLALKKILPGLKNRTNATKNVGVLSEIGNDISLNVIDSYSNKVTFQDFISSLVLEEQFSPLSVEEYQEHSKWIEQFNNDYKIGHIFVSNTNVTLMYLSHKKQKINVIIELMKSKLKSSSVNETEVNQNNCKAEYCYSYDHQSLTQPSDNGNPRKQENMSDLKSHSEDEKIINEVYCFKNSFVLWLLHTLNLRSTVAVICPILTLELDVLGLKVFISGQSKQVHAVKQWLKGEDDRISYNKEDEAFLQDSNILQQIKSEIQKKGIHLVLSGMQNLKCSIKYQDGKIRSLAEFASHFVVRHECLARLSVRLERMPQWKELLDCLHSKHPFHKIFVEDRKIFILKLDGSDAMETNEIEHDINKFILHNYMKTKSLKSNASLATKEDTSSEEEQHHSEFLQNSGTCQQKVGNIEVRRETTVNEFILFLKLNEQDIQFLNMFLQQDLNELKELFRNAGITIESDGIKLQSSSQHCVLEMSSWIKSIFGTVLNVTAELQYPGLVSFFKSEDGLKLICEMSTKYECFIEPPMDENNQTNTVLEVTNAGLEVLMPEDERINYKVTLLGTAKCPGFKVHLLQGNVRDIKSDVKVEFCISSEAQECVLKTNTSTCDITIVLPRQKALCESAQQERFNKLWESLSSVICLVLDQVKYLKSTTVTFDTSALHGMEFAFSLDVIARLVTEQLLGAFTDSSDSSGDVDIYFCEPKCEAVFKALSYYMKRMGIDFETPDQVRWDQICEREHKGRASSPCTDSIILVSKVSSHTIKYWGKSRSKIKMAHCDVERELNRLMRDNILTCGLNKKETSNFEKLSHQMRAVSVLMYYKKHFTAQNQGQQPKTIITGSELTIQGLSQVLVRDFRDMIISEISKEYKLERSWSRLPGDIKWSSHDEDKFNTYDIDPANILMAADTFQHGSTRTFKQNDGRYDEFNKNSQKKEFYAKGKTHYYGIDVSKNQRDHNAGTSAYKIINKCNSLIFSNDTTCPKSHSASSRGRVGSFKWLYEASEKTSSGKALITFKPFYGAINQMIEAAYSKDKKISADIKDGKVTRVDFSDMTVIVCGKKKGLIRVEELDTSQQGTKPAVWTVAEDEVWKDINLVEDSEQFQKIESELKEKIPVKIKKLNIKRIENINLFQRFKTKNSQLDGGCTFMWHKVSEDNVLLVCQFGFHPRFSTMRDENMGDGVLFKASPWDCLEEKEIMDKKTVFLFRSRLALGRTGPGRKRFRCVAQDTIGQPQDSVQVDDQVMIFSDAQAYPSHLITFTVD
ncbi:unnamed protein product [Lymnaea stagnalis]|uniref:Uncharacterized protein n=1 Tax=Lymnaea stagnalis TaxID=6523 RepID=A0AAV2GZA6_LYMST